VQKEARDYVDRRWGSDTKIVDPELDAEAQEGPTCLAMVANRSVSKGNGKKIPLQRARVELLDLLIEDVQAGRRTVAEVVQMGSSIGYDDKVIRRYLRKYGARVGAIKKVGNHDVKLGHIKAGLKKGWMVKTTVRFGPDSTGNYTYHAVLVEDLVINPATGRVAAVRVYDPMVGVIEVPRKRFIELFKGAAYFKNNKKEYLLMFIRFDSV
jgi:hypothetical protein